MLNPNCSLGVVSFVCAWSVASHRRKTSRSQERIDRVMVVGLYQSVSYVSNHKDTETQRQSGSRVRSCLDDESLCLCVFVVTLLDRSAYRSLRKTYRPAGQLTGTADR